MAGARSGAYLGSLALLASAACTSSRPANCPAGSVACDTGCCEVCNRDADCPNDEYCCSGRCGSECNPCDPGETYCRHDFACHDVTIDVEHCGGCGDSCFAVYGTAVDTCAGSRCVCGQLNRPCLSGFSCCPGGCQNTQSSRQNCGDCGNACDLDQVCLGGICTGDVAGICGSRTRCAGPAGPECVDTQSDAGHCGGCGNDCDAALGARVDGCRSGACVCAANGAACAAGELCEPDGCRAPSSGCAWQGGAIAEGATVTAYRDDRVACGGGCVSEQRRCTGGVLDGSFVYPSCSVGSCNCDWQPGPAPPVANGTTVTAYQTYSVPCGQSCVSEQRTCTNGSLSGSYPAASCTMQSCPPEIIASSAHDGAAASSFDRSFEIHLRVRNLTLNNAASCVEVVGSSDALCANLANWTAMPANGWYWDSTAQLFRTTFQPYAYPAGQYRLFWRNTTTGQQSSVVLTLSEPPAPEVIYSATVDGPAASPVSYDQEYYGRVHNLNADNAASCVEVVSSSDGYCSDVGNFTTMPNADWSYDAPATVWRATFGPMRFPRGQYRSFWRNTITGQIGSVVLTVN